MTKELLPKPQTDLPLPEKELTSGGVEITPIVKNEKPTSKPPVLKFVALGILFVIGLALIGGAYFMGTQKSENSKASASPTTIPNENLTANWQTYESTNNGYSIKYPSEWYAYSLKDYPYDGYPVGIDGEKVNGKEIDGGDEVILTSLNKFPRITAGEIPGDQYIGITLSIPDKEFKAIGYTEITINEVRALKKVDADGDVSWLMTNSDGKRISISMQGNSQSSIDIIDHILSTFKFTDSASSVINYEYKTSGISFKYPDSWEIINEVPNYYKYTAIDDINNPQWEQKFLASKMISGNCNGPMLKNKSIPNSVILMEIKDISGDGGYCWSSGNFVNQSSRPIASINSSKTINVSKWTIGDYEYKGVRKTAPWNGDLFQMYTVNGIKKFVAISLIYQNGSDPKAEEAFDKIISTFKITQ